MGGKVNKEKKGISVASLMLNTFFVLLIILAGIITIVSLSTQDEGVANVAGFIPYSIQSESMEDTIMKGDLIFTRVYDGETLLDQDEIISFFAMEQNQRIIKTHRILEVNDDGLMVSYTTQGDNNIIEDAEEVPPGDVISVYNGVRIPKVGYALDFFSSKYGFLFGIILPMFIFFIYQLYVFIELIVEMKYEKKKQA